MSDSVRQKQLSNGLRIVCESVRSSPVVALQAWVRVGSADELPREAGLAHLHEHMLFKGTARRGVGEIAREIEAAGGEINAWTSFDETVYHVTMASKYFGTGLDVLADAVQHSAFDAEELAREKEVVLEEIRRGEDQPARRLSQRLFSAAFRRHSYGLPIIGTPESVSSFTRKDVVAFYKKWYVPNNITFVIVGDIDSDKAIEAAAKAFGRAKPRALRRPRRLKEAPPRAPRIFTEITEAGDSYSALAFPAPELMHPDAPGIDVLADILGGSETSRLFTKVQAEAQLVSAVYAHAYTPRDPGLFFVGANPFPGKELEALSLIRGEIARIRESGISEEELERAKLSIEAESVYARETVQGRARKWGYSLLETGDLAFEERYLESLRRISTADVARLAQTYLQTTRLCAGLFVPGDATDKSKKAKEKKLQNDLERIFKPQKKKHSAAGRSPQRDAVTLTRLSNGIRVVLEHDPSVPVIAFKAVALGGSRYEKPEEAGLYHFLAEMLPRGAGERSVSDIREEVEAIAGSADGVAGRNTTGADVHCLSRFWKRGLDLWADVALRPALPDDEIVKVRAETLAALDRENDQLAQMLFNRVRRELYGDHPYGFRVLGEREIIEKVDAGALRRAHERLLVPERMVLSVVGAAPPDAVLEALGARFGSLRGRPHPTSAPQMEPLDEPRYTERVMDRQQAHLAIAFRGTLLDAPDRFALEILNGILAGQGGRLFTELRDKLSLAYSVTSFAVEGLEPGLLAAYIGTAPDKLKTAYEAMRVELDRVRSTLPSREELQRAKRHLIGSHAIDHQRCGARASLYALNELYGLGYRAHEKYADQIAAVTAEDVRQAAEKYLRPERGVLGVIRPERAPSLEESWIGDGPPAKSETGRLERHSAVRTGM